MSLRSRTEYENGELRHAGMDGRHPGAQDASGDIHVALDSSTPCWNDTIEAFPISRPTFLTKRIFNEALKRRRGNE